MLEEFKSRDELSTITDISPKRVNRELDDLRAIKLVDERKRDNITGRKTLVFRVKEELRQGIEIIGK
jgi:predicted ArsR family transcriptional regulator